MKHLSSTAQRWLELTGRLFDTCDINGDGTLSKAEFEYAGFLGPAAKLINVAQSTIQLGGPPGELFFLPEVAQEMLFIDTNSDRKIDRSEFHLAVRRRFRSWGFDVDNVDLLAGVDAIFQKADTDSDGALGLRELQFALFLSSAYSINEMTRAVFWDMDLDNNGMLEWEEVIIATDASVARGGPHNARSIADQVRESFVEADVDRDRRLSHGEVTSLMEEIVSYITAGIAHSEEG